MSESTTVACRSEFHEDDYSINCKATKFNFTLFLTAIAILAIPVGVPALFLFYMLRQKKSLPDGEVNVTAMGGAKLLPVEAADESDDYGFLIRDYRPKYW